MADFTYSEVCGGVVGYPPPTPIDLVGIIQLLGTVEIQTYPAIDVEASFGLYTRVTVETQHNDIAVGLGLSCVATASQTGQVGISGGFGLNAGLSIIAPGSVAVECGFGISTRIFLGSSGLSIAGRMGLGSIMSLEQEQGAEMVSSFGLSCMIAASSPHVCRMPVYDSQRWS